MKTFLENDSGYGFTSEAFQRHQHFRHGKGYIFCFSNSNIFKLILVNQTAPIGIVYVHSDTPLALCSDIPNLWRMSFWCQAIFLLQQLFELEWLRNSTHYRTVALGRKRLSRIFLPLYFPLAGLHGSWEISCFWQKRGAFRRLAEGHLQRKCQAGERLLPLPKRLVQRVPVNHAEILCELIPMDCAA